MGKLLVIGTGAMGFNHARVCAEIDSLVGVCDLDEESAKRVGEEFGVPWYTEFSKALIESDAEGAIIATPTD